MGNYLGVSGEEESEKNEGYDPKRIYWDADGNLRHGHSDRNRDEEIIKILQADTNDESDMTKLWMIIPSRWVRMWLLFAHFKVCDAPGPIDMLSLMKKDKNSPGGWAPKKGLLPPSTKFGEETPGHYRRISLEAWVNLVELYGIDGYAIAVRGYPYDDITRWRIFKDPKRIDINLLPEPVLPEETKKEEKSTVKDFAKSLGLGGLFGASKDTTTENKK